MLLKYLDVQATIYWFASQSQKEICNILNYN